MERVLEPQTTVKGSYLGPRSSSFSQTRMNIFFLSRRVDFNVAVDEKNTVLLSSSSSTSSTFVTVVVLSAVEARKQSGGEGLAPASFHQLPAPRQRSREREISSRERKCKKAKGKTRVRVARGRGGGGEGENESVGKRVKTKQDLVREC